MAAGGPSIDKNGKVLRTHADAPGFATPREGLDTVIRRNEPVIYVKPLSRRERRALARKKK